MTTTQGSAECSSQEELGGGKKKRHYTIIRG